MAGWYDRFSYNRLAIEREEEWLSMTPEIRDALAIDMIVDITTRGRKSGRPRRIEIWSHYFDGRVIVAGSPGKRGWHANLIADPRFTYHIKHGIKAGLPAVARPIRGKAERRAVLTRLVELSKFRQQQGIDDIEDWVAGSPLVEVTFEGREIDSQGRSSRAPVSQGALRP